MNSAVGFDTDKWGLKTVRFLGSKIDPEDDLGWLNDANIYGADNCDISNPDSLTNFINWAAKVCPAKPTCSSSLTMVAAICPTTTCHTCLPWAGAGG